MGQEEYREVSSFLRRFVLRLKLIRGIEGLCLTAICAVVLFGLGPGVFQLKDLLPYAPLVYSLFTGAILAAVVGWTLWRFLAGMSHENAALAIEEKHPKLRNNLINSLQLYPQMAAGEHAAGFSASMVLALLRTTRRQIAGLRLEELLDTARLRSSARLLALLFLPVAAMVLFHPAWVGGTIGMLTRPLDYLPPSETHIDLTPKGLRVARGAPVTVEASTAGAIPASMELNFWPGEEPLPPPGAEKIAMEDLGGGRFKAHLPRLARTVRYRAVAGGFSSAVYTAEAVDPPEIANVQLTVYPPAYAGLGPASVPEGNAEALKGSTLRVDAAATKDVVRAEIVLDDGKEIPLKIDGRRLQGSMVLFQAQSYRILVEDAHGFKNSPIRYELRVKPDGFPTVDLLRPTEDLEINGDEILTLEYGARDDFGIAEIALMSRIGDREEKIVLQKDGGQRLILRDQYRWDLGRLGLREGEEAVFFLQVLDNDTISGPKIGVSRSVTLKLKNLRAEHQQVAEMIRDLNSRMLDMLADHLETPPPGEKAADAPREPQPQLDAKLGDAAKRTEEIMRRTEQDRLSDFATWSDLEALRRNLEFTKDELLKRQEQASEPDQRLKARDDIAAELERMSLLSEDMAKRLKAQEAATSAQDLARSQERLMDALDKLAGGDKNLDAILKQISELAKTLANLQQALSQLAQQMPDDFMNPQAMQGLGFDEMQRALEEIRKKLQQGDIEGARQLARELFSQMAQMVAALQNAQRSAMTSNMGRMQGEMQRQTNELQEIAREQQEILLKTEKMNSATLTERDAALKAELERFLEKAIAELGDLTKAFPDREGPDDPSLLANLDDATMNALLRNLIAKLSVRDFPGYREGDGHTRKELAKKRTRAQEARAQQAEKSLESIKEEMERLLQEPVKTLSESERRALRDLAHRQDVLRERTEELHEKLESLFQVFPQLDPKIVQGIGEAGQAMGSAHERLGRLDAPGAVPPERTALESLSRSQQQMQQAMQQMAQRGQLGNMPITRLFRQGRFLPYGSLTPLPGTPEFPQFDLESGFTGLDTERFRLPGKDDYKAPRNFREEILDSLKQGVPPQMKDQIERYFRNLSE